jgi:hypothetical protein
VSYDIDAVCPCCNQIAYGVNPTYNYREMFLALGIHPKDFNGKPVHEYAKALADALHKLNTDFATYHEMNAPNGWGTAAQLRGALPEWIANFEQCNPSLVMRA